MTKRLEFSQATKQAAWERSGGICECGCGVPIKPGDGPEYDHDLEATLGGDNSLENCRCVRSRCHKAKTASRRPEIDKGRRIYRKRINAAPKFKRPMPGSRASGWKQKIGGQWERR